MLKKILFIIGIVLIVALLFLNSKFHFFASDSNKKGVKSLQLKTIADIPLTGNANRLDYQSINYENHRLYITHLGSDMVHVFDLRTQKIIKDIPDISSPHGILVVPELKEVYVSASGKNQIDVIDEETLTVINHIPVGDTPDGIAYDPNTHKLYVSNENGGTISVIDAKTNEHVKELTVGGAVGNTQYDGISKLIYSAGGYENKLVEVDSKSDTILHKYDMKDCSHPHGFYIDTLTHYALVTCDANETMITLD